MPASTLRKRIALLIADPASDYSQAIITGVRDQCAKYNYDLLVFSTMVKVCHPDKHYLDGERNIFRLVNYDLVDGVLVASLALYEDRASEVLDQLAEDIRLRCKKPVLSLDLPFCGYPTVYTDDQKAIRHLVQHLVQVHHCRQLYMLTGPEGFSVSEGRADAFCAQMQAEGLDGSRNNVFYGNFWYNGGEDFASRILSGELAMPDAVVCGNDYMAVGLSNRLTAGGVRVPEQVRITGYDATREAVLNDVSITTYAPDVYGMAADAVDRLRRQISPALSPARIELPAHVGLRTGISCGCAQNVEDLRLLHTEGMNPGERKRNPDGSLTINDMQGLHESYMFETLTALQDKDQILDTITDVSYLLQPYRRFYLVLRCDWSDPDSHCFTGYPASLRCVMRCISRLYQETEEEPRYAADSEDYSFPTSRMLPALDEERPEPVVFYFLPSHFYDDTMGYAVLQTTMDARRSADEVSTLWLRNVNNALHMVRLVSRLIDYSIRDSMTGLLNRRGMEMRFHRCCERLNPGDSIVIWVIDMDGLKYINDHFGHEHGDAGIMAIAEVIRMISGKGDIAVRTGGDEFVVISAGQLSDRDGQERIRRFEQILAEKNHARVSRQYDISASIGYVCFPASEENALDERIKEADRRMYAYKTARKKQRCS